MKQIVLGTIYPGSPGVTSWKHPQAGSIIDFDSLAYAAQRAEAAKIDIFFMPEGLRLLETAGQLDEDKITGRPDSLVAFAALTALTQNICLVATLNSTYNEPYDLARQLATLDHLSNGRAGWNIVTSSDPFTGANFRRGGYLPYERRYARAAEVLQVADQLWQSWPVSAVVADRDQGQFIREDAIKPVMFHGKEVSYEGSLDLPEIPSQRPLILQAGESEEGRDFAAQWADAIFTHHLPHSDEARQYYRDTKQRMAHHGRQPEQLNILTRLLPIVAATHEEAKARAQQLVSENIRGDILLIEFSKVWGRDLTGLDPDGAFPDIDPDPIKHQPNYRQYWTALETVQAWHQLAKEQCWSPRQLAIHLEMDRVLYGTAEHIADYMIEHVQSEAVDGYLLAPPYIKSGSDEFFDRVIPVLQARGAYKKDYRKGPIRQRLVPPYTEEIQV